MRQSREDWEGKCALRACVFLVYCNWYPMAHCLGVPFSVVRLLERDSGVLQKKVEGG